MNKTQTKLDAERYVAPWMKEHVIACSARLMQNTSDLQGCGIEGYGNEQTL